MDNQCLIHKYHDLRIFNQEIYRNVAALCSSDDFPHLILNGPPGCGKDSLLNFILEKLYGPQVHKIKTVTYKVTGSSNKSDNETIKQSNFHLVIFPSETNHDRYTIQTITQEFGQILISKELFGSNVNFKTIVVNNVDTINIGPQASLRRTMETMAVNCRFILKCRSISSIMDAICSRAYVINIPAPSTEEILSTLMEIDNREKKKTKIPVLYQISLMAENNIKKAVWYLDDYYHGVTPKNMVKDAAEKIVKELLNVDHDKIEKVPSECSKYFYDLNVNLNINTNEILKKICYYLCQSDISDEKKEEICSAISTLMAGLVGSRRPIFHIKNIFISILNILYS